MNNLQVSLGQGAWKTTIAGCEPPLAVFYALLIVQKLMERLDNFSVPWDKLENRWAREKCVGMQHHFSIMDICSHGLGAAWLRPVTSTPAFCHCFPFKEAKLCWCYLVAPKELLIPMWCHLQSEWAKGKSLLHSQMVMKLELGIDCKVIIFVSANQDYFQPLTISLLIMIAFCLLSDTFVMKFSRNS